MIKLVTVVSLCALFLAGCGGGGGGNSSVDANGHCTQQLIDEHNDMGPKARALNALIAADPRLTTPGDLDTAITESQALSDSCDRFFSNNAANVSCMAQDADTGEPTQVSTASVKSDCDGVKSILAQAKAVRNPAPGLNVDSVNGNCSQQVIDDYNSVTSVAIQFESAIAVASTSAAVESAISQGQEVSDSCDQFFARHASNLSCKAQDAASGTTTQMATSKVKSTCNNAKNALATAKAARIGSGS